MGRKSLALAAALAFIAALCASSTNNAHAAAKGGPPYYFGTLVTSPDHAKDESAKGLKMAMLELSWHDYEPAEGQFDQAYALQRRADLQAFKNAGMQVTLGLGLHDTPNWVMQLPDSKFIDEKGKTSDQTNLVFNQVLRNKAVALFDQINKDLGINNFWAIRLTSGGNAEMLYPDNSGYWAFDKNAQNGPNMPPSMARNPLPGWKPGDHSVSTTQVRSWVEWYLKALTNSADWQIKKLDSIGFKGYYEVLTPGSGVSNSGYEKDIVNYLPIGSVTPVGAVWHKFYEFFPNKNNRIVLYDTGIADTTANDEACSANDKNVALTDPATEKWAAARWHARIADQYGLRKLAENPGYDAPPELNSHYVDASVNGMMAGAFRQVTSCGFMGLYWAHDEKFWDGTVSLDRYAQYIKQANGGYNPVPPPAGSSLPMAPSGKPAVTAKYIAVDNTVTTGPDRFVYQGTGWKACSQCGNGRLYKNTTSWTGKTGDQVTIVFTGTQIILYGETDPTHGVGEVFLDGTPKAYVKYSASTRVENRVAYTSPILKSGTHQLVLRNVSKQGYLVPVDRVVVRLN